MTFRSLTRAAGLCWVAAAASFTRCEAQTVAPYYAGEYSIRDLGDVPGVPFGAGALVFKNDDPNTLVVRFGEQIMTVRVRRNVDQRIIGFSEPTLLSSAGGYVSSFAYGPNGVLFFNDESRSAIGQVEPGDAEASRYVDTDTLIVNGASLGPVGGLAFVPAGFTGSGKLKFSDGGGFWYETRVSLDGSGTYNIENPVSVLNLPLKPDAVVYVPAGHAKFPNASIVATHYGGSRVVSFEVNASGDPVASTVRDVVTEFPEAMGLALDPVSGDFLMTQHPGGSSIYLLSRLPAAPPSVALTSPANNSTFGTRDQIPLAATASAPAGSSGALVVEFYDGATLVGSTRDAPFQASIAIVTPGVHALTAVATANGLSTTSSVVNVTITLAPNALPAVQLTSPLNSITITECSSITLAVTASDSDGSVTGVSFFANSLLLGTVAQPPYTLTVDGLPFAINTLTAVATDDSGGRSTSAARTVFTQILPLHTLNASLVPGNRLRLCFRGAPGSNYVFEVSGNIIPPVVWQPFATNIAPGSTEGLITLMNALSATDAQKFYRARQEQ